VFWTLAFAVLAVVCAFLTLGHDGFWLRAMRLGSWYATRNPQRAARLQKMLDAFAMRWDMILDRLPEGSVDGLYLPDFSEMATAEVRYDAVLDRRFANLREGRA
jgi:hypothetical protein